MIISMHLSPAAAYVLDTLNDNGYKAWLVGGCVRDSLRGSIPSDFDIASTALPQQVMSCFPDFNVVPTGIRHGTVTVVADGGLLEITTLRTDGDYADGRHPDKVTFVCDITADLARRDFTINAMAWNSIDGLIDPFGGQADLADRVLRCVGDPVARLHEDSLRIMRCLRFASCLGFNIDPHTAAALYSECEGLRHVAAERLKHELSLLICGELAGQVICDYHDILSVIFPEIIPQIDKNLLNSAGNDCAVRLALVIDAEHQPDLPLRRLRFDSDTIRRTAQLCALMRRTLPANRTEAAELTHTAGRLRMEDMTRIWSAQAACAAQPEASQKLMTAVEYVVQVLDCGCCSVRELAIDGNTLIDIGILPDREMGRLLAKLTHCVMAGSCRNEVRQLTDLARQLYRDAKM